MPNSGSLEKVKAFVMTNQMLAEDLTRIASLNGLELGHMPITSTAVENAYYPQFEAAVRKEAALMGQHYEVFYCLEKTIRALVSATIKTAEKTENWWPSHRVPQNIKDEVAARI